ncbi:MAG TPA: TIGR03067 domain-containing protein [Gemmataceae bacterium]|nr:TIGR03067 domain-containing protein [Gemmataceae bacterium]
MNSSLVATLAFVVAAPALKDPPKGEPPSVIGEWELQEWLDGGKPRTYSSGASVEFLPDGRRIWREDGTADERSYKLISKTTPYAMDLIRPSGAQEPAVFHAIYKVEGDTLVICVAQQGQERPVKFDTSREANHMVMTYKRMKKK